MQYILKGICNQETIDGTNSSNVSQYSFDLRPRSFNFIQIRKINEMIKSSSEIKKFSLCFEDEKTEMVTELYKKAVDEISPEQEVFLEFSGDEKLEWCEQFQKSYIWHYNENEKISNIDKTKYLKRVVFKHEILQEYHHKNELHGFLNLFADYTQKIYFEVQLDWDSEIIISLFDFFQIPMVSFEMNNKIEKSFQQPDVEKVLGCLESMNSLFLNK